MVELDVIDLRILARLQGEGRATHAELSETAYLSASQVQRRVKRLEDAGVIARYAALLSAEALGLGVLGFTTVSLKHQGDESAERFHGAVLAMAEVQECHKVSGDADYMLKIIATDLRAFANFLTGRVLAQPAVSAVRSYIVFESVKNSSVLPLPR